MHEAPNPEAVAWRTKISVGIAVISLTAYGLIGGAILQSEDPLVVAKLAGRGLQNFAAAGLFAGLGTLLWWATAEQKLGWARTFTAIAAAVITVGAGIILGDNLIAGVRATNAYLSNPVLVHGKG